MRPELLALFCGMDEKDTKHWLSIDGLAPQATHSEYEVLPSVSATKPLFLLQDIILKTCNVADKTFYLANIPLKGRHIGRTEA